MINDGQKKLLAILSPYILREDDGEKKLEDWLQKCAMTKEELVLYQPQVKSSIHDAQRSEYD